MRIGEVARAAGLNVTAVRFYESKGLVSPVGRAAGQRRYDRAAVARLGVIATCRRAGFTLAEIALLLQRDGDDRSVAALIDAKLRHLGDRRRELDAAEHLLRHALSCGCTSVDECRDAPVPLVRPS